jgi:hypothetical protein
MRFGLRNTQKRRVKGVYSLATPNNRTKDGTRNNKDQTRGYHSAMGPISPDFFLVNSRLRDEKLLRFDSRLVDASEKVDREVGGRLSISAGLGCCSERSNAGELAPSRLDIEPFGVLRFLLGNRPNCAVCREDMEDTERGDGKPGVMADAPDTEEYAESFPVKGGL